MSIDAAFSFQKTKKQHLSSESDFMLRCLGTSALRMTLLFSLTVHLASNIRPPMNVEK